jgi:hypothetical protein
VESRETLVICATLLHPCGAFHCAVVTSLMEKCGKTGVRENKKTIKVKGKV